MLSRNVGRHSAKGAAPHPRRAETSTTDFLSGQNSAGVSLTNGCERVPNVSPKQVLILLFYRPEYGHSQETRRYQN